MAVRLYKSAMCGFTSGLFVRGQTENTGASPEKEAVKKWKGVAFGITVHGKLNAKLILCVMQWANKLKWKSRLYIQVNEHSADVRNIGVYVQHSLRTFIFETSEGHC